MISFDSLLKRKTILFDIGSSNTRVCIDGKVAFSEPTCIAIHTKTQAVLAIGTKAVSLLGKTPKNIIVVFPIKSGVVASEVYVHLFLDTVLQQLAVLDVVSSLFGLKGIAAVPSDLSPVNITTWKKVFQKANVQEISCIEIAKALYTHIAGPKALTHSICIVDVGGQKTDISVLSAGEIVVARTYALGGVDCTEIVQDTLYEKESFVLGWQSAEKAKKEMIHITNKKIKEKTLVLRGKDAHHHVAKTIQVKSSLFEKEMEFFAQTLVENIRHFFSLVPPELAASTLERGIYISGGGAVLQGLKEYIETELKTEIVLVSEPQQAGIKGLMALSKA